MLCAWSNKQNYTKADMQIKSLQTGSIFLRFVRIRISYTKCAS